MARFEVNSGSGQIALVMTVVSQNPGANQSTVRVEGWVRSGSAATWFNDPRSWSTGGHPGARSGTFTHPQGSGTGWRLIVAYDSVAGHAADGTLGFTGEFAIGATGTAGLGGPTTTGPRTITVPRITVAPGQATGVTATRVSDTVARIAWAQNVPANAQLGFAVGVDVSVNGGAWQRAWTGTNPATRQVDIGIAANRRTQFRVVSSSQGGAAPNSATVTLFTTPAAPTGVSAARTGIATGQATVRWTNNVPFTERRTEVQRGTRDPSTGAITWIAGVVNVAAAGTSHTFTGLPLNQRHIFRVRAVNTTGGLASGWVQTGNVDFVVPPGTPTALTHVRNSDTQLTMGWTRNHAWNGVPTRTEIQTSINGGAWVAAGSLGNVASHTGGFAANRRQVFRVRQGNDAGWSPWSAPSAPLFSTPLAPADVAATREGALNVRVRFTNRVAFAEHRHEIQRGTANASGTITWLTGVVNVPAGTTTHLFENLPGGDRHVFRVRAVNTTGGLASGWVQTAIVQLQAPPSAPTVTALPQFTPDGGPFRLAWQHQPVDASQQSRAQVQASTNGGASWTTLVDDTGALQSADIIPDPVWSTVPGVLFRVRTWGSHATASAWSTAVVTRLVSRGVATITSPANGVTLDQATLLVQLGFAQGQGATATQVQVELLRDGVVVGSQSATTLTVPMGVILSNGGEYTLRARVQDTFGTWTAWVQVGFATQFPVPQAPVVAAAFIEESGAAQVTLSVHGPPGEVTRTNIVLDPRAVTTRWRGGLSATLSRDLVTRTSVRRTNLVGTPRPVSGLWSMNLRGATGTTTWPGMSHPGPLGHGYVEFVTTTPATGSPININPNPYAAGDAPTVIPGQQITVRAVVRQTGSASRAFRADLQLFDAGGVSTMIHGGTITLPDGQWYDYVHTFTVPAGAASLRNVTPTFTGPQDDPVGTAYAVAGVIAEAGPTVGGFFDGDTPDTATHTHAWTGEPRMSPSAQTFDDSPALPDGTQVGTYGRFVVQSINQSDSVVIGTDTQEMAAAGRTLAGSFLVRSSHPLIGARIRIDGTHAIMSSVGPTIPAGEWHVVDGAVVTPDDFTINQFNLNIASANLVVGQVIDVTAAILEVAEMAQPFFDGDTISTDALDHEWTGAQHNSQSVQRFLPGPATVTVTRDAGDGPEVLLVDHPWDGSAPVSFIDTTPTLNGVNRYEAVAATALRQTAIGVDTLPTHGTRQAFLNSGPGMANLLPLRGAVTVSSDPSRASEVVDLGDRTPVTLYGDSERLAVSVQVDELDADRERVEGIETFIRKAGLVCYRDPSGRRIFGRLTGGVTGWHGRTARLAFTVEEST